MLLFQCVSILITYLSASCNGSDVSFLQSSPFDSVSDGCGCSIALLLAGCDACRIRDALYVSVISSAVTRLSSVHLQPCAAVDMSMSAAAAAAAAMPRPSDSERSSAFFTLTLGVKLNSNKANFQYTVNLSHSDLCTVLRITIPQLRRRLVA